MHSYQPWAIILAGILFHAVALAVPDNHYNASYPYRLQNVTGLDALYHWVGSYYNGTTTVEIIPLLGASANESVCPSLRDRTFTFKYDTVLGITERGPDDTGTNPVNVLFTLWEPGHPASISYDFRFGDARPFYRWKLESSHMMEYGTGDDFNLTLSSETTHAPYNLTGHIYPTASDPYLNLFVHLPVCDPSAETGEYSIAIVDHASETSRDWDWTVPVVNIPFDDRTANLTFEGSFNAFPYLFPDPTVPPDYTRNTTQGRIHITFHGAVDAYRSDVLVTNGSTPRWLRTVGFGNNSLNIGYGESLGWKHEASWSVMGTGVVLALLAILL